MKDKKLLIFLGIGGGIILLLFFFFFFTSENQKPQDSKQPENGISNGGQPVITGLPANISEEDIPRWNMYDGSTYQFEYPPDWYMQKTSVTGRGEVVGIKPNILQPTEQYPQLIIEVIPEATGALAQKIQILKAMGLQESKIIFSGIPGVKLSGTISLQSQPIQETAIIVQRGTDIYTFKYQYQGAQSNSVLEEYFMEMVNSFRFK